MKRLLLFIVAVMCLSTVCEAKARKRLMLFIDPTLSSEGKKKLKKKLYSIKKVGKSFKLNWAELVTKEVVGSPASTKFAIGMELKTLSLDQTALGIDWTAATVNAWVQSKMPVGDRTKVYVKAPTIDIWDIETFIEGLGLE